MNLPEGFQYAGMACGIKASSKEDISLIIAADGAVAAGVYTQNIVRAASIDWNVNVTPSADFRAVVINSGNANACTGDEGATNNRAIAQQTADALGVVADQVAVLSTGVIGVQLPMEKVRTGIASAFGNAGKSPDHFMAAATGITTTDKSTKTATTVLTLGGETVNIAAMAKGAGMIGPRMATMLGIVTTDAAVSADTADEVIRHAVNQSFNCISVEGHMSTNDALILVASGKSAAVFDTPESIAELKHAVTGVCIDLAKQIPADGEGATHLIQIDVTGAPSDSEAHAIARTVANSALVKTAITGSDPNWGRIVSAVGYARVPVRAEDISLKLNGTDLFVAGQPVEFDAAAVSRSISARFETEIELRVGNASGVARHWTSDLTVDYVRFNSEYTT